MEIYLINVNEWYYIHYIRSEWSRRLNVLGIVLGQEFEPRFTPVHTEFIIK